MQKREMIFTHFSPHFLNQLGHQALADQGVCLHLFENEEKVATECTPHTLCFQSQCLVIKVRLCYFQSNISSYTERITKHTLAPTHPRWVEGLLTGVLAALHVISVVVRLLCLLSCLFDGLLRYSSPNFKYVDLFLLNILSASLTT